MHIKINITKLRLYMGTLIFLLSGHLYLLFDQTIERIFLLASIPFFYKEYGTIFQLKKSRWHEKIHFLFILCFIIDVVIYFTATPIIYALGMFYVWVVAFKVFPYISKRYGIEFYKWIYKVNLAIALFVVAICFLLAPIRLTNYSGIFVNPNTFGNYAAFATAFLIPVFLDNLKHKNIKKTNLYVVIFSFLILCLGVVISSSRTAFLTIILELVFLVFYVLKIISDNKKKSLFKKIFIGFIIVIVLIIYVLLFTDLPEILDNAIFDKFVHLSDNQLNGRGEYWEYIWEESKIFENGLKDIPAAHNVYFGLIDQFGKLAGILYLGFVVLNFLKNIRLSMKKNSAFWQFCSVFAGIAFVSVSMTENYLLTNSMLWFYIMIPIQDAILHENANN